MMTPVGLYSIRKKKYMYKIALQKVADIEICIVWEIWRYIPLVKSHSCTDLSLLLCR